MKENRERKDGGMENTTQSLRGGWQKDEVEKLWQEVTRAAEEGTPLRGVFEKMGQQLGRKPNSVRNYYYMQLRARGGDSFRRAAPFETFTPDEIHALVKNVLAAKSRGQSVRACVMDLSQGDKAKMLRLQNKYRSCLRKRPEIIESVLQELRDEGVACENPLSAPRRPAPGAGHTRADALLMEDADAQAILDRLSRILSRNALKMQQDDRAKVQRDLALIQLEEIQLICRGLIDDCKAYLGNSPQMRAEGLDDFCEMLLERLSRLESAVG